jgi:hypothetical protein
MRATLSEEDDLIALLHDREPALARPVLDRRDVQNSSAPKAAFVRYAPRFCLDLVRAQPQTVCTAVTQHPQAKRALACRTAATSQPLTLSVVDLNACTDLDNVLPHGTKQGSVPHSERLKRLRNIKRTTR